MEHVAFLVNTQSPRTDECIFDISLLPEAMNITCLTSAVANRRLSCLNSLQLETTVVIGCEEVTCHQSHEHIQSH